MAAMVALNEEMTWDMATQIFSKRGQVFVPSEERKYQYEPYYRIYRSLYPSLKDSFHALKKIQKEEKKYV